jgi:hypothetical protein
VLGGGCDGFAVSCHALSMFDTSCCNTDSSEVATKTMSSNTASLSSILSTGDRIREVNPPRKRWHALHRLFPIADRMRDLILASITVTQALAQVATDECDEEQAQAVQARAQIAISHLDPTHKNFDRASRFLLVSFRSHMHSPHELSLEHTATHKFTRVARRVIHASSICADSACPTVTS